MPLCLPLGAERTWLIASVTWRWIQGHEASVRGVAGCVSGTSKLLLNNNHLLNDTESLSFQKKEWFS